VQTYRFLNNGFWLADVDTNEANNSFDPTQFFNGKYALDIQTPVALAKEDTQALAADVQNINPAAPTAPQQLSLIARTIAAIRTMLGLE